MSIPNGTMILVDQDLQRQILDKLDAMESELRRLRQQSEAPEEIPEKLNLTEAANILGKTRQTIANWTKPGGCLPKHFDGNNQPYVLGSDVRVLKYGK